VQSRIIKRRVAMKQQVGTIVGSSVHLTGAIKDSSDITIFGSVEGEVSSDQKIIIEESARVKGPVKANEIIVSGLVIGTITATQRLELNQAGIIKGNIDTSELLIHAGATFIGKCNMPDKKDKVAGEEKEPFSVEVEVESDVKEADEEDSKK
jgi:cytoskeletal protein CcmA (bactofilin family)